MPGIPQGIRDAVRKGFYENGLPWLQEEIQKLDPLFFESGEMQNPHRVMRALEFVKTTGDSIRDWQKGNKKNRPFNTIKIGLELPKDELHKRIHARVDDMMKQGLLEEVKRLLPYQHLKALQTVGYRELFDHLDGLSSLDAAVEFIKTNTRQYAERQMTWFKKDGGYHWISPSNTQSIVDLVCNLLQN